MGNECFENVGELKLIGLSELETLVVGERSFTKNRAGNDDSLKLCLKNCPKLGKYLNSGFDPSSFLKTGNSSEFSSSCTTRIVPILTTGVSFLRSYKVSNKRPIMGHPRSDVGCPGSVLVGPGQSQDGLVCLRMVQDSLKPAQVWLG